MHILLSIRRIKFSKMVKISNNEDIILENKN